MDGAEIEGGDGGVEEVFEEGVGELVGLVRRGGGGRGGRRGGIEGSGGRRETPSVPPEADWRRHFPRKPGGGEVECGVEVVLGELV